MKEFSWNVALNDNTSPLLDKTVTTPCLESVIGFIEKIYEDNHSINIPSELFDIIFLNYDGNAVNIIINNKKIALNQEAEEVKNYQRFLRLAIKCNYTAALQKAKEEINKLVTKKNYEEVGHFLFDVLTPYYEGNLKSEDSLLLYYLNLLAQTKDLDKKVYETELKEALNKLEGELSKTNDETLKSLLRTRIAEVKNFKAEELNPQQKFDQALEYDAAQNKDKANELFLNLWNQHGHFESAFRYFHNLKDDKTQIKNLLSLSSSLDTFNAPDLNQKVQKTICTADFLLLQGNNAAAVNSYIIAYQASKAEQNYEYFYSLLKIYNLLHLGQFPTIKISLEDLKEEISQAYSTLQDKSQTGQLDYRLERLMSDYYDIYDRAEKLRIENLLQGTILITPYFFCIETSNETFAFLGSKDFSQYHKLSTSDQQKALTRIANNENLFKDFTAYCNSLKDEYAKRKLLSECFLKQGDEYAKQGNASSSQKSYEIALILAFNAAFLGKNDKNKLKEIRKIIIELTLNKNAVFNLIVGNIDQAEEIKANIEQYSYQAEQINDIPELFFAIAKPIEHLTNFNAYAIHTKAIVDDCPLKFEAQRRLFQGAFQKHIQPRLQELSLLLPSGKINYESLVEKLPELINHKDKLFVRTFDAQTNPDVSDEIYELGKNLAFLLATHYHKSPEFAESGIVRFLNNFDSIDRLGRKSNDFSRMTECFDGIIGILRSNQNQPPQLKRFIINLEMMRLAEMTKYPATQNDALMQLQELTDCNNEKYQPGYFHLFYLPLRNLVENGELGRERLPKKSQIGQKIAKIEEELPKIARKYTERDLLMKQDLMILRTALYKDYFSKEDGKFYDKHLTIRKDFSPPEPAHDKRSLRERNNYVYAYNFCMHYLPDKIWEGNLLEGPYYSDCYDEGTCTDPQEVIAKPYLSSLERTEKTQLALFVAHSRKTSFTKSDGQTVVADAQEAIQSLRYAARFHHKTALELAQNYDESANVNTIAGIEKNDLLALEYYVQDAQICENNGFTKNLESAKENVRKMLQRLEQQGRTAQIPPETKQQIDRLKITKKVEKKEEFVLSKPSAPTEIKQTAKTQRIEDTLNSRTKQQPIQTLPSIDEKDEDAYNEYLEINAQLENLKNSGINLQGFAAEFDYKTNRYSFKNADDLFKFLDDENDDKNFAKLEKFAKAIDEDYYKLLLNYVVLKQNKKAGYETFRTNYNIILYTITNIDLDKIATTRRPQAELLQEMAESIMKSAEKAISTMTQLEKGKEEIEKLVKTINEDQNIAQISELETKTKAFYAQLAGFEEFCKENNPVKQNEDYIKKISQELNTAVKQCIALNNKIHEQEKQEIAAFLKGPREMAYFSDFPAVFQKMARNLFANENVENILVRGSAVYQSYSESRKPGDLDFTVTINNLENWYDEEINNFCQRNFGSPKHNITILRPTQSHNAFIVRIKDERGIDITLYPESQNVRPTATWICNRESEILLTRNSLEAGFHLTKTGPQGIEISRDLVVNNDPNLRHLISRLCFLATINLITKQELQQASTNIAPHILINELSYHQNNIANLLQHASQNHNFSQEEQADFLCNLHILLTQASISEQKEVLLTMAQESALLAINKDWQSKQAKKIVSDHFFNQQYIYSRLGYINQIPENQLDQQLVQEKMNLLAHLVLNNPELTEEKSQLAELFLRTSQDFLPQPLIKGNNNPYQTLFDLATKLEMPTAAEKFLDRLFTEKNLEINQFHLFENIEKLCKIAASEFPDQYLRLANFCDYLNRRPEKKKKSKYAVVAIENIAQFISKMPIYKQNFLEIIAYNIPLAIQDDNFRKNFDIRSLFAYEDINTKRDMLQSISYALYKNFVQPSTPQQFLPDIFRIHETIALELSTITVTQNEIAAAKKISQNHERIKRHLYQAEESFVQTQQFKEHDLSSQEFEYYKKFADQNQAFGKLACYKYCQKQGRYAEATNYLSEFCIAESRDPKLRQILGNAIRDNLQARSKPPVSDAQTQTDPNPENPTAVQIVSHTRAAETGQP